MKPARGSARSSTQAPKGGGKRRLQQKGEKPLPNEGSAQDKSRKSSAPAVARKSRKQKGQENWKPLGKSSIAAIDNMMGLSILSVVSVRRKEKEESQKQLNLLKDQFMAKCAQLLVPPRKPGNTMQVSRQFQAECQKIELGKKKIKLYEESIREVTDQLEQLEGRRDGLEDKCRIMRNKLEELEENAQEFSQLSQEAVLRIPALPAHPDDEPTLQEQLMKMVRSPKAVTKSLQSSKVTGHVLAFLELAHKQADQLLTHPVTTDNEAMVL